MSVRLLPSIISNGTLYVIQRLTNISPRNCRGNKAATAGTFLLLAFVFSLECHETRSSSEETRLGNTMEGV